SLQRPGSVTEPARTCVRVPRLRSGRGGVGGEQAVIERAAKPSRGRSMVRTTCDGRDCRARVRVAAIDRRLAHRAKASAKANLDLGARAGASKHVAVRAARDDAF